MIFEQLFINTDGTCTGNIPLDLKQEFMNNLLKVSQHVMHFIAHIESYTFQNIFRAQGGKANFWEWAALVGPLCELLQDLNRELGNTLGTHNGNRHAAPDLSVDIQVLMESLEKHEVYEVKQGRKLAEDDKPVVDCIAAGRSALVWGTATPIHDFNANLDKLCRRLRVKPLIGFSILHQTPDNRNTGNGACFNGLSAYESQAHVYSRVVRRSLGRQ